MRRRVPGGAPLLIELDPERAEPLYRQLYRGLRDAILSGRLRSGVRIPSTRVLAEELGISRTTVITAVRRLTLEGFLEARVGAGTWVADHLSPALLGSARAAEPADEPGPAPGPRNVSRRAEETAGLESPTPRFDGEPRPFQLGVPALDRFPLKSWARIAGRKWRSAGRAMLGYGEAAGCLTLREAVAKYLRSARGVACEAAEVIIVSGSQHGLDLVSRVLLDRGDRVWVEDPGYPGARGAFIAGGVEPVAVPVDAEGLDVEAGRRLAPGARLAYVTPSHQFPLGVSMSLPRRLELLGWARENGAWVLEDDYDSEYRYGGTPLMSLHGLDSDDRVLYLGTFSKTLFPSLRLAFLVLPGDLVDAFRSVRSFTDQHPPTVNEAVLAEFMEEGHYVSHLRRMRRIYRRRRDLLIRSLEEELAIAPPRPPEIGLHLVVPLPEGADDREVSRAADRAGVQAHPLSRFRAHPGAPGLVLGFGAVAEDRIRPAVRTLASVLADRRRPDGSTTP